ncbi:DUF2986 domain-containing protein [Shewanella sp. GXUN23E]|uniref:DUF2986 domain-containing protein n=1 Tax=Shewanella sp. GXUN23E TaxID=3422498 RepID=UPI003D7EF573
MNRRKKINQTLIAKDKKKKAKLHGSNKPKYVSKAEREILAGLATEDGMATDTSVCAELQ